MRISKTYTSPTPIDRTNPSLSGFLLEPPPASAQFQTVRTQIEALLEPGRGTPTLRVGWYTGPVGANGPTTFTERELVWVAVYPGGTATRACIRCPPAAPAVELVVISDATKVVLTGAVLPQAPDLG